MNFAQCMETVAEDEEEEKEKKEKASSSSHSVQGASHDGPDGVGASNDGPAEAAKGASNDGPEQKQKRQRTTLPVGRSDCFSA